MRDNILRALFQNVPKLNIKIHNTEGRSKFSNQPEDRERAAYFHAWLGQLCQLLVALRPTQCLLASVCHPRLRACVYGRVGRRGTGERERESPRGVSPSPHHTHTHRPRAKAGTEDGLQMSHARTKASTPHTRSLV